MRRIVIFGLGYTASRIAAALDARDWLVISTGGAGTLRFDDAPNVRRALAGTVHVLSSVPPDRLGEDAVLASYGDAIADKRLVYLSSTGVYGDTAGAWVDESSPVGAGRRSARASCDAAWLARGARVLRLPGIYGPGRSPLDRVREGRAHRIDQPGHVFSRVHVDDIVTGALAAIDAPPGAYNLADDLPCGQNAVIEEAARLLGVPAPPLLTLEQAQLSPMASGFYAENRRVANGKAKRLLGWRPRHPTYVEGLRALADETAGGARPESAMTSPASASAAPPAASQVQR